MCSDAEILRDLARAKVAFQLRAIEAIVTASAIETRQGGDVEQAPSRSDESATRQGDAQ